MARKKIKFIYVDFLANIMDPDKEHSEEEVCEAIASHYSFKYSHAEMGPAVLNTMIASELLADNLIKRKSNKYWTLDVGGVCSVWHNYTKCSFVTSEGKKHSLKYNEEAVLKVNGKAVKTIPFKIKKIHLFIDEIETLFSKTGDYDLTFEEINELAYERFPKGSIWDGLNQLRHCCTKLAQRDVGSDEDQRSDEFIEAKLKGCWFVYYEWCAYLWDMKEEKKDPNYVLSFRTFISRNQDRWIQGLSEESLQINVYTDEHKIISESLAEEQFEMDYKTRILKVWENLNTVQSNVERSTIRII